MKGWLDSARSAPAQQGEARTDERPVERRRPAGAKATLQHFKGKRLTSITQEGLESVSVPGAVEGWNQLLAGDRL